MAARSERRCTRHGRGFSRMGARCLIRWLHEKDKGGGWVGAFGSHASRFFPLDVRRRRRGRRSAAHRYENAP
jgi:hypothetical protein